MTPLYPSMVDSPELRWSFIRKVCTPSSPSNSSSPLPWPPSMSSFAPSLTSSFPPIACHSDLLPHTGKLSQTIYGCGASIVFCGYIIYDTERLIKRFSYEEQIWASVSLYADIINLFYYHQKHPLNYILLFIFTVTLAFAVGLTCTFTSGGIILESVILTTIVVVSLTLYTFWAAKRGHDFNFLGPFLLGALLVLMLFAFIQLLLPLGRISTMIYGVLASIIFCGYILYDTDNLIKRDTPTISTYGLRSPCI
ncbi:Protein LIFEGUARD 2 [Glycine max]|nr:Protein LIFEGUARD 2 [Glycine max]